MSKCIIVNTCMDCLWQGWNCGDFCCGKTKLICPDDGIPEWCPLPNAPQNTKEAGEQQATTVCQNAADTKLQGEIATKLLKQWIAVYDNEDLEFNDMYIPIHLHKETLEFINSTSYIARNVGVNNFSPGGYRWRDKMSWSVRRGIIGRAKFVLTIRVPRRRASRARLAGIAKVVASSCRGIAPLTLRKKSDTQALIRAGQRGEKKGGRKGKDWIAGIMESYE